MTVGVFARDVFRVVLYMGLPGCVVEEFCSIQYACHEGRPLNYFISGITRKEQTLLPAGVLKGKSGNYYELLGFYLDSNRKLGLPGTS